jgi:hypothetical protein
MYAGGKSGESSFNILDYAKNKEKKIKKIRNLGF